MDYVRNTFYIKTNPPGPEDFEKLAAKSNTPLFEIIDLFRLIQQIHQKNKISEAELLSLNNKIEKLKARGNN